MPMAVIRERSQPVLRSGAPCSPSARREAEQEVDLVEPVLDLMGDRPQVPRAVGVGQHVDAPEQVLVADGVRGRLDLDRGDVGQPHPLPRRRVDAEVADVVEALAGLGDAPDLDVVRLAGAEDVGHLLPRDQRRRGAAHVTRFQPVPLRRRQVDLDRDLGHLGELLGVLLGQAVDAEQRSSTSAAFSRRTPRSSP
jgi:hypothetical protein